MKDQSDWANRSLKYCCESSSTQQRILVTGFWLTMSLWSDGKRPDGVNMTPLYRARCLTWDVTVPDTLAASYEHVLTSENGGAASENTAHNKEWKMLLSHSPTISSLLQSKREDAGTPSHGNLSKNQQTRLKQRQVTSVYQSPFKLATLHPF